MLIRNDRFVRPNGDPYVPILVSSLKPGWVFGGDIAWTTAKKGGVMAAVKPHYYNKLRKYQHDSFGKDAVYGGVSSPDVATRMDLPYLANLTQQMVRGDRLRSAIDIDAFTEVASAHYERHPKMRGWHIVEPAWEGIFAGLDPEYVAYQILTISRIYRSVAPTLQVWWGECGSYSEQRGFTRSSFGRCLDIVLSSPDRPDVLGAHCYPTHPEKWDGPDWWGLLYSPSGNLQEGLPVIGIGETGWQPNETIETNWDESRAARLGVKLPPPRDMKQYSPVPGTDQLSAYRECFRRWVIFNRRALGEFGAKFLAWHSACGHGQQGSDGGWIPWGPIDAVSGYWHPPTEVQSAVVESLSHWEG